GKVVNLRVPLLAVVAYDDPIMAVERTPVAAALESEDLMILLTKRGGHVGWPTGWRPSRNKFKWLSGVVLDYS
ncbi:unnamed protein product, partial [Phaeothamnion confervicola]